jgi:FKBP-type peptidyl-prolyl cis-trans isomerase 2
MNKITSESVVTLHYTGKLESGEVFDSTIIDGREPMTATLGQNALIKGFEEGLLDMEPGEKKTIFVNFQEGYGFRDENWVSSVPRKVIPPDAEIGSVLSATGPNGERFNVRVEQLDEEYAVLDANHPLAGKNLIFEVEIVSVQ